MESVISWHNITENSNEYVQKCTYYFSVEFCEMTEI